MCRVIPGALILLYHRVARLNADPFRLAVHPAHFAEQMEILRRRCRPIGLQELCRALAAREVPRRAVVVTFDDGYADNLYEAKPLLERWDIPATVFAVAEQVGDGFWWDDLHRMLAPGQHAARIHELADVLRPMPVAERVEAIAALRANFGCTQAAAGRDRAMTSEELIKLAADGLVEVGAHTCNHPLLPSLSPGECRNEIARSKSCLEDILGRAVTSFAYPFGAFRPETSNLVREIGFQRACTTVKRPVRRGSDCYVLPRVSVKDWDGERFGRWLSQWGL